MTPKIGIREAKARLSELLREVKRGRRWIITERGQPVAMLGPVTPAPLSPQEWARRMEAAGLLSRPKRGRAKLPLPIPGELLQKWLREDRDKD